MAQQHSTKNYHENLNTKKTLTESVISVTFGNVASFTGWLLMALLLSILIEWIGMLFLWDTHHSRDVLHREITYLSQLDQNMLFMLHPATVATWVIETLNNGYRWLQVDKWLPVLQSKFHIAFIAMSSAMDVTYTLVVRLAIVTLALPAFLIWGILGLVDGLVDRDIRKECGGIEHSYFFHRVKPWIVPSLAVSCGLYLTLPFTFNPGMYFLIPQALFFIAIYFTASTFKKYL